MLICAEGEIRVVCMLFLIAWIVKDLEACVVGRIKAIGGVYVVSHS